MTTDPTSPEAAPAVPRLEFKARLLVGLMVLLLGLQADVPRLARIVLLQPGLLTQAPATLANKLVLLLQRKKKMKTNFLQRKEV